ncbi:LysR family transcriptional regulator [Enterobacter bugandensis]|uniref:LysR family transcriptional regulator n=1 Tax=Enterobacter bugandensis TaxID=881260 RepID=UPI001D0C71C5|nr:LysR family transcriptional regulator [Enterobacter bugandensis]MCC2002835.1 LysR family transcriptional regulator [Enterobacter bugandensis]MDH2702159.1 LysR family transcriptional regulator [Enterobacter bugandensis]
MSRISDMDIDLLLALDALLQDRNITHAAARLGISQPALSARLARLRTLFGEPLFIPSPHGRGVLPTPRAEALRPQVESVLRGICAMFAPTAFEAQTSSRTFVIALHENPALMLGTGLLNQIRTDAPGIRLRFALPEIVDLPQQLENGDVDIYIGVSAGAHDGWVRRKLLDDAFATAQRKGHPRGTGPLDLDSYCALSHLVVSSAGDPFTGFVDQTLAGLGYQRHVAMSTQSYAMAPALVAGTDLVCTLPERMLKQFASILDIFPPPLPLQPITINMYWHPKNSQDPANAWLRGQLLRAAGRQV